MDVTWTDRVGDEMDEMEMGDHVTAEPTGHMLAVEDSLWYKQT